MSPGCGIEGLALIWAGRHIRRNAPRIMGQMVGAAEGYAAWRHPVQVEPVPVTLADEVEAWLAGVTPRRRRIALPALARRGRP